MNKTLLLTGGTGSFGQGFIKMLAGKPEIGHIRVYSRSEHKQQAMRRTVGSNVSFFIGDVRDKERLTRVMAGCDWVIHAAALKQAPVGEIEPQEFIKTNILGSMNVIEAALDSNVEKALLISTDKAVEPINLYGATKMCAEKMFLQADKMRGDKKSRFSVTRYGNVAGTDGSIVPVLMSLGTNEPSVIFDPFATRFWISLEDANRFVFESITMMLGGELFIPKMKSAKVVDIIKAIRPDKPIKIMGDRDGDKRHEVIAIKGKERVSSDQNEFMSISEIRNAVNGK